MSKRILKSLSNEDLKKVVGGLPRGGWVTDPSQDPNGSTTTDGGGTVTANNGGPQQGPRGGW